ncbi:MAG: hypothetical protein GYA43_06820, partial [Bacteroidales bacterium]|nr:hypothetical protein [Bacteroidales bacterium]
MMDKNTITGLILIFLIFIGFSIYNNHRLEKIYKSKVVLADSLYATGNYEKARAEYMYALNLRPNNPEVAIKINDLNRLLGTDTMRVATDTVKTENTTAIPPQSPTASRPDTLTVSGVFGSASRGVQDYITLENELLELKISLKGGRIYSARLKEYTTYDGKPLILFDGDSTVFGFNFFTADNKPVRTNDLYFSPVSDERHFKADKQPESVSLRLCSDSSSYIMYTYTIAPGKYMVDFKVDF